MLKIIVGPYVRDFTFSMSGFDIANTALSNNPFSPSTPLKISSDVRELSGPWRSGPGGGYATAINIVE